MLTSERRLEQTNSSPADSSYWNLLSTDYITHKKTKKNLSECLFLVLKKIRRLEEELESLGGSKGDETVRSTVIKSPSVTPRKVYELFP